MNINITNSDEEITACFPVMQQLRLHLDAASFVERVRAQQQAGYQLAAAVQGGEVVAVAGFRIGDNLAWGHFMYVDDLVTLESCRSQGYGKALLTWLRDHARQHGCAQLHLDSGMQRLEAHRFYEREGMEATGYHFAQGVE